MRNLTGERFGRLVVLAYDSSDKFGKARWRCRCDCGVECVKASRPLISGDTKSCGCLHQERAQVFNRTHGYARTPIYRVWCVAKGRCDNPKDKHYKYYGGRGIRMCEAWRQSFAQFQADMGPRPPGMTLDRKDNNGHYEPGNCRWATKQQQMRNTTRTIRFVFQGKAQTLGEWAEETGLAESLLYHRIVTAKWPVEKALTKRSQAKKHLTT